MMYVQQYGKIYIYWIKLLTIFFWRYSTGKKHVMMTIQRNWYTTFLYCFLFLIKINLTVLQKDWMFVIYCKNWIWMYSTSSKGLLVDKPINVWKYIVLSEKNWSLENFCLWGVFQFPNVFDQIIFNMKSKTCQNFSHYCGHWVLFLQHYSTVNKVLTIWLSVAANAVPLQLSKIISYLTVTNFCKLVLCNTTYCTLHLLSVTVSRFLLKMPPKNVSSYQQE